MAPDRARLRLFVPPQPGYPFALEIEVEHVLDAHGLTVRTTGRNIGDAELPFGAGFHPYLTVGTPRIDDTVLQVQAGTRLVTDERGIPTGERAPVAGTAYDFATPRPIGATQLDTAFGDLARDDARARHRPPAGARRRRRRPLARRAPPLPHALHRRHAGAARAPAALARRRADDLRTRRVPQRRRAADAHARRVAHVCVGYPRGLTATACSAAASYEIAATAIVLPPDDFLIRPREGHADVARARSSPAAAPRLTPRAERPGARPGSGPSGRRVRGRTPRTIQSPSGRPRMTTINLTRSALGSLAAAGAVTLALAPATFAADAPTRLP